MMPALLERPKLSKEMAAALKHHIQKERERKRQEEEEADKAIERKREEQEKLRKKQEAETLSLEETKEQLKTLEEKLKSLQAEKHELFLQLKKVLNEDENRRRQQMKEKNEMLAAMGHNYHPAMHIAGPHMIVPTGHLAQRPPPLLGESPKNHMYRSQQQTAQSVHGVKRARSPSPPVVQLYPQNPVHSSHYPQGPYGQQPTTHSPFRQQAHPQYTTAQTAASTTYVNQAGYPHGQGVHYTTSQANAGKYPGRDSAFSSYPAAYVAAQQQKVNEQYSQSYQVQQQRKLGYIQGSQSASNLAVQPQQQVEQSSSKGGYAEDGHYQHKLQGQHVRSMAASHPQALHAQQSHQPLLTQSQVHLQPQSSKPSLLASYQQQRRRPESPIYQQHKKASQQQQQQQPPQHGNFDLELGQSSAYASSQQARTSSYPPQSQHQPGPYMY